MSLSISGLGGLLLSEICTILAQGSLSTALCFDPARPPCETKGFSLINCSPEALRVGGLVTSIYGAMGSSALVLLVSCLGQSLAALALLSFSQFECCLF